MSAETPSVRPRRPVTVTVAVVLVYISGIVNVLVGTLVLLSRYDASPEDVLPVSLLGAGLILFGLLTLAVASGLSRGSRLSRNLLTLYLIAQVVLHGVTIAVSDTWDWTEAGQILLELLILAGVWAPPGSRHFARDSSASADPAAPAPA